MSESGTMPVYRAQRHFGSETHYTRAVIGFGVNFDDTKHWFVWINLIFFTFWYAR